jgi:hypothetical protein
MDISMNDGSENDTKRDSEEFIDSIQSSTFTMDNYIEYQREVLATERTIIAQLENNKINLGDIMNRMESFESNERFKTTLEQEKIVPEELYRMQKQVINIFRDSYGWMNLLFSMYKNTAKKESDLLNEQKKLAISRDVLREVKEMDKASREFFHKIFNTEVESIRNQYLKSLEIQRRENAIDRKEIIAVLIEGYKVFSSIIDETKIKKLEEKTKNISVAVEKQLPSMSFQKEEIREEKKVIERQIPEEKGFSDDIENEFSSDFGD